MRRKLIPDLKDAIVYQASVGLVTEKEIREAIAKWEDGETTGGEPVNTVVFRICDHIVKDLDVMKEKETDGKTS